MKILVISILLSLTHLLAYTQQKSGLTPKTTIQKKESKKSVSFANLKNNQVSAFPSGQVLYLNFNNNFNDQSGSNNVVINNNVSFASDPNNAPNSAANFDGCSGSRAYLKVSNSASLQVTNALTICFWAKVDLSNGMNPNDGTCGSVGHHILFAKGGDGFGTAPKGIYSKLQPDGANALNLFGSSPNSGNLAYTTTISAPNTWKFYTYIITTTQYQFYINGTLQNSGTHSINLNEVNNEDLYIGVLGPKSTPALGIANWYPMSGQMDDFRVFNRALDANEISSVYNLNNNGDDAPAMSAIYYVGDSYYYSSTTQYHLDTKSFNFSDEKIILSNTYGRYGNYKASIIKCNTDSAINKQFSQRTCLRFYFSLNFSNKRYSHTYNI